MSATTIIARDKHSLSRSNISDNALKVLYRLKNANYAAYLVGGGVRDILLGLQPKDFDVATDAKPEEIRRLFRNCRLIGRRFRIAHVFFKKDIVEVTTFRRLSQADESHDEQEHLLSDSGMLMRDNVYGELEDDAFRRDFTVNALYYNIADFSIVDHSGGLQDLEQGLIRMIGDPKVRYQEDPIRILRAVRLASKLNFNIEESTLAPINEMAPLLEEVPSGRLFNEFMKISGSGSVQKTFQAFFDLDLLQYMFPGVDNYLKNHDDVIAREFFQQAFINTDKRIAEGKSITPLFLIAVLLWPLVWKQKQALEAEGENAFNALQIAGDDCLAAQQQHLNIPKRLSQGIRDIWALQHYLPKITSRKVWRSYHNPRFRAAYDFLLLRVAAGENELADIATWWTEFQQHNHHGQEEMLKLAQSKK